MCGPSLLVLTEMENIVQPEYLEVLLAVLGGGAVFTFLSKALELFFHRGKSLRDELRTDIVRLETTIIGLQARITMLEGEVETWKNKVDEWRNKYYELLEQSQFLKLTVAAKDQIIATLEAETKQLKRALANGHDRRVTADRRAEHPATEEEK